MKVLFVIAVSCFTAFAEEECGIKGDSGPHWRIIDGHDTKLHEFPWMAFTGCGASIINNQWLATAGHCTGTSDHGGFIWLGLYNIRKYGRKFDPEPFAFHIEYSKSIRHPDYDGREHREDGRPHNDIALIKLKESLDFNGKHKTLMPVCLPNATMSLDALDGKKCVVTGWGVTEWKDRGHEMPEDNFPLQQVSVPIVGAETCLKKYPKDYFKDTEICAGGLPEGGAAACYGDSGGPLQCQQDDGKWYLIGIVSWGQPCGLPGYPDVYARVSALVDWVHQTIKEN